MLAEYARLYAAGPEPTPARQLATESGVSTIASVGTAADIPLHEAVARMFGRH